LRLFVYGKLKTGEAMSWLLPESMFETRPHTPNGYRMYVVGNNKVAGLVEGDINEYVFGEIKESRAWVPNFILRLLLLAIDMLETMSKSGYKREEILLPGGSLAWAYLYTGDVSDSIRIYEWSKEMVKLSRGKSYVGGS